MPQTHSCMASSCSTPTNFLDASTGFLNGLIEVDEQLCNDEELTDRH